MIFIVSTLVMGVYTFQMYRQSAQLKNPMPSQHTRQTRPSLNEVTKSNVSEQTSKNQDNTVEISESIQQEHKIDKSLFEEAFDGNGEKLKEAIENGLDINTQNDNGQTLLMSAINGNSSDLFFYLLSKGADPNIKDKSGQTALVFASSGANEDMTLELLKKGADPNVVFNSKKFTLLMDSSFEGNINITRHLVEYKAEINAINADGKTALHYAAREGHLEIVKLLLANGANKNIRDSKNKSALEYAAESEFQAIETLLK